MNLRTKSFKKSLRTHFKNKRMSLNKRVWEHSNERIRE